MAPSAGPLKTCHRAFAGANGPMLRRPCMGSTKRLSRGRCRYRCVGRLIHLAFLFRRIAHRDPFSFLRPPVHLLYLDEPGQRQDPGTQFFVLAGFAVFERSIHWLKSRIHPIAVRFRPQAPPVDRVPWIAVVHRQGRLGRCGTGGTCPGRGGRAVLARQPTAATSRFRVRHREVHHAARSDS